MRQVLLDALAVLFTGLATGLGGWFFGRKKANAEAEASQIENAEKLLDYYIRLNDDLGKRLTIAIDALKASEIEKQEAIRNLSEATKTIHDLEKKVGFLTEELGKYRQLNRKT